MVGLNVTSNATLIEKHRKTLTLYINYNPSGLCVKCVIVHLETAYCGDDTINSLFIYTDSLYIGTVVFCYSIYNWEAALSNCMV